MAQILHCDCCKAQDGSIDGNAYPTGGAAGATQVPTIKVWHAITLHGHTKDICNRCLAKIEAILGFELFDKTPKPTPRKGMPTKKEVLATQDHCAKCKHAAHEPGDCNERVCDAAGDMDWCPC